VSKAAQKNRISEIKNRQMAKKEKGEERKGQKKADEVMHAAGGHGTNVLALHDNAAKITVAAPLNYDPQLDIEPAICSSALNALALGIVLAAKRRGWNGTNTASDAYLALRYLVECFTTAIEGGTLTFTSAPRWFWELITAFRPKSKNFGTGRIYYEGTVVQNSSPNYSTGQIPFFGGKYTVILGATPTQNAPLIVYNGFQAITPYTGPYDSAMGLVAFNAMWSVFAQIKGTPTERVSAIGDDAVLRNDASVFAWSTTSLGVSDNAPGGLVTEILSEVYPVCPILAKFCLNHFSSVPEGQGLPQAKRRTYHRFLKSGGTACYIGPRMAEMTTPETYRNPIPARFKFYNFDEYVEQAALVLALAQENMSNAIGYNVTPYPLTSQEFQIVLRQTLIPFFNNEMLQDTIIEADNYLREMLPLTVSDNGVSLTIATGAPLFPLFFSEMVRGASRLTKHLESASKKGAHTLDLVPILCRPGRTDQLTQYVYSDRDGNSVPLFKDPAGEISINLIDCSVVDGNNIFYVNLNGGTLGKLVEDHNAWMTKHASFFTTLSPLIQSVSNPLFSTVVYDTFVTEEPAASTSVQVTSAVDKRKSMEKALKKNTLVKGTTYTLESGVGAGSRNSYFTGWEARKLGAYVPLLSGEHAKWIQMSITPIIVRDNSGSNGETSTYFSSCYKDAHSYMLGNTNVDEFNDFYTRYAFANLFQKHYRAASVDVKGGYGAAESDIEVLLNTFSKEGEGSFLATLSSILTWTGKFLAGL
jgi:hypothetical protein